MPGVITGYEITHKDQLLDLVILGWATDELSRVAANVPVDSILVTEIWGSNTIVFRDMLPGPGFAYRLARMKAAELAGIGTSDINEDNHVHYLMPDRDRLNNMIGAVRMNMEALTGSGDIDSGSVGSTDVGDGVVDNGDVSSGSN